MQKKQTISILGAGYVGLCTAVGFASKGFSVIASEVDDTKASKISMGIPPFHEPGLEEKLKGSIQSGNLKCLVNQTEKAVLNTDITFVTVGTPSKPDGSIDLGYIESAAKEVGSALKQKEGYHLTVVKSTVIPGTTQNVVKSLIEKESSKKCGVQFGLCMNPEFLRQGSAFHDTVNADRLVIGSYDKKSGDQLENLYRQFYGDTMPPTIRTTLSTAELIKYASNAMLATKISYINTIANICEKIPGADVKVVASAMGLDRRIGPLFLDAGLGYGGSCFPKDVKALIACAKTLGDDAELLESVENVNHAQPLKAVELCRQQLGSLDGKKVAVLGLAFKPDTDDMREARVVPLINQLLKERADVVAYDPVAVENAKSIFGVKIHYAKSAVDCITKADCAIIVTEWPEFQNLTPKDYVKHMKQPNIVDGRRIYNPEKYSGKIKYAAIGLGK